MREHTRPLRPTLMVLVALLTLTSSLPVADAAQEKPEGSMQCWDNGWRNLTPQVDPPIPFADQDDCEAYAEQVFTTVMVRPAYEPRTRGACAVERTYVEQAVPEQDFAAKDFSGCDLSTVSLIYADLTDANLSGAALSDADLNGVTITGPGLWGAGLAGADVTGSTLAGAFWFNTTCPDGSNSDDQGGSCAPASETRGRAPESTPRATGLPAAMAPYGLGTVTLPDDIVGITALFARLPATIADVPRASTPDHEGGRVIAAYGTVDPIFGSPLTLQALNFATGDFFPREFTVADFVASAADTSDYDAQEFGLDGTLAWVRAETRVGVAGDKPGTPTMSRTVYTLAWGHATSPWLFGALADSPEGLEALVRVFVETAGSPQASAVNGHFSNARHSIPLSIPAGPCYSVRSLGPW